MGKYIACICEGGAERDIIDLLLYNHRLIFERDPGGGSSKMQTW